MLAARLRRFAAAATKHPAASFPRQTRCAGTGLDRRRWTWRQAPNAHRLGLFSLTGYWSWKGQTSCSDEAAPPEFKSEPWAIHFSLPSDLSELEGVVDPLLFVYAGSGFVRDLESKMDLLVAMAREQGHSWTEIGRALGVD